jgi:superkiller protein 3
MGVAAREAGEHAEAADLFRKALELEPGSAGLSADLADVLTKLGRLEEAAAVVQKSLEMRPRFLPSLIQLGQILLQQKEYEKAKRVLEDAIQIDPGFSNAYYGLATAYARLGDQEKSKACLEKLKALRARDTAAHQRSLKAADGVFDVVRTVADVSTAAAKVYLAYDEPAEAEQLLLRASQVYPNHAGSPQALAWLYEQQGRSDEALKTLTDLRDRLPGELSVHVRLGELYARLQQFDKAEQAYTRAIEIMPSQAESYVALADLYLQANRKLPEAKVLALKAVDLRPSADCYALLGATCQRNGDRAGARSALQHALVLDPRNAQYRRAYEMLGGSGGK